MPCGWAIAWWSGWVSPSDPGATVQLSVPVIAALGGIVFLGEPITGRLVLAFIAILGGIALSIRDKASASDPP